MQSQDIVDKMFPKMFEKLYVGDFGSGKSTKEDGSTENFVRLHYFYEHLDSGSNGSEILSLTFDDAGTLLAVRRAGTYDWKKL